MISVLWQILIFLTYCVCYSAALSGTVKLGSVSICWGCQVRSNWGVCLHVGVAWCAFLFPSALFVVVQSCHCFLLLCLRVAYDGLFTFLTLPLFLSTDTLFYHSFIFELICCYGSLFFLFWLIIFNPITIVLLPSPSHFSLALPSSSNSSSSSAYFQ